MTENKESKCLLSFVLCVKTESKNAAAMLIVDTIMIHAQ
nr:MAG TPA: hypothetical protein [Caudoviricetes sp.]